MNGRSNGVRAVPPPPPSLSSLPLPRGGRDAQALASAAARSTPCMKTPRSSRPAGWADREIVSDSACWNQASGRQGRTQRVAGLVVVEREDLCDALAEDRARLGVDDGGRARAEVVARDELEVRHLEDVPADRVVRRPAERREEGLDALDIRAESDGQVDERDVGDGDADRDACQVATSSSQSMRDGDGGGQGRKDAPLNLPARLGRTSLIALAAPVDVGMMLPDTPRPVEKDEQSNMVSDAEAGRGRA